MAVTLSVCMIVRDEALVLERCLRVVSQFADEIVIVDTGSADGSMEIAGKYTNHIYQIPWQNDFAAARNVSYSHATCEYLMWMDADDDMEPEDIARLLDLKQHLTTDIDVVFLTYDTDCDGVSCGYALLRDRIIRRELHAQREYPVHEGIPIPNHWRSLCREDIVIYHRKLRENEERRNIRIFEQAMARGFRMDVSSSAFYCRELALDGQYEQAVQIYQQLKENGASYPLIHYARFFYVESMKKLRRYPELEQTLLEELVHWPPDENVYCFLGDAFLWNGKAAQAEECYDRALHTRVNLRDFCMHDKACSEFLPCVRLANLYARRGDWKKALTCFRRAREICPQSPMVLCNQAYFAILERKEALKDAGDD